MSLLLIRHGETDLNASRVVQFPDTPLGANGRRQADRLGQNLAGRSIGLILSSDYARARMTAAAIAGHTGASVFETPSLRERNFGDMRGRAYDDLGDLDLFAPDYEPPNGESWPVFNARVDRAWREVLEHAGRVREDIAVVTHGLVVRSLIERVVDTSGHVIEPGLSVANTSVTTVSREPPWRLLELARADHLDALADGIAPV